MSIARLPHHPAVAFLPEIREGAPFGDQISLLGVLLDEACRRFPAQILKTVAEAVAFERRFRA